MLSTHTNKIHHYRQSWDSGWERLGPEGRLGPERAGEGGEGRPLEQGHIKAET